MKDIPYVDLEEKVLEACCEDMSEELTENHCNDCFLNAHCELYTNTLALKEVKWHIYLPQ